MKLCIKNQVGDQILLEVTKNNTIQDILKKLHESNIVLKGRLPFEQYEQDVALSLNGIKMDPQRSLSDYEIDEVQEHKLEATSALELTLIQRSNIPGLDDLTTSESLFCPISRKIFNEPVVSTYGHVVEKEVLVKWVRANKTCPFTGNPLSLSVVQNLTPDIETQRRVSSFLARYKNTPYFEELQEQQYKVETSGLAEHTTALDPRSEAVLILLIILQRVIMHQRGIQIATAVLASLLLPPMRLLASRMNFFPPSDNVHATQTRMNEFKSDDLLETPLPAQIYDLRPPSPVYRTTGINELDDIDEPSHPERKQESSFSPTIDSVNRIYLNDVYDHPSANTCEEWRGLPQTAAAFQALKFSEVTPAFIRTHWRPSGYFWGWDFVKKEVFLYLVTGKVTEELRYYLPELEPLSNPLGNPLTALQEMTELDNSALKVLCQLYPYQLRGRHLREFYAPGNKPLSETHYAALVIRIKQGEPLNESISSIKKLTEDAAAEIVRNSEALTSTYSL